MVSFCFSWFCMVFCMVSFLFYYFRLFRFSFILKFLHFSFLTLLGFKLFYFSLCFSPNLVNLIFVIQCFYYIGIWRIWKFRIFFFACRNFYTLVFTTLVGYACDCPTNLTICSFTRGSPARNSAPRLACTALAWPLSSTRSVFSPKCVCGARPDNIFFTIKIIKILRFHET